ncbi:PREDICTED: uncharacterized protein LOC106339036 [Brassica oleracea var. oleracea]|uniref:uncharacterized protein LOC106339036 n=1 Tax=Brassica oleracea var. oleracea TaxID=109376 RepID=UPI0006A6C0E0|nr:PREDICTED: uncharacterized protein LOC106339036 [Brassica oleracea var. oleracea]
MGDIPQNDAGVNGANNIPQNQQRAARPIGTYDRPNIHVYSGDHDRGSRTDDKQTGKELKALQDKIYILIADKATQEQLHFVGNPSQETPPIVLEVEGLEEILEKILEAQGKGKVGEEKKTLKDGEVVTSASESSFVPPPYEPKLPFPGRFKKQLQEKYKALFEKQMSEAQVAMPIIDAFMLIPQYIKFLKDVVAAKKKEMKGMMILTHECSAIIQRLDVPEKLEDPGCFTLPLKYPVGILEDLPVKIGRYEIPTDFVVLEMGEEAQDPLILGRPFLATAGAIVNVKEGTIDLHLGKENILHFDIKEKMRKPTVFGQAFYIEEMDTPADEHLEVLPSEDDEEGASPSTHSP